MGTESLFTLLCRIDCFLHEGRHDFMCNFLLISTRSMVYSYFPLHLCDTTSSHFNLIF